MNVFKLKNSSGRATIDSTNDPVELKGGLTPTSKRRQSPTDENERIVRNDNVIKDSKQNIPIHQTLMTQLSTPIQLPKWDATPGLQGIYNHGNTCFMNTILQCLSSTDLFSDYFIQKKYKEVLNGKGFTKRLVGSAKGEVCEEVGRLLESLWSGSYTPEITSHFKSVVSKFNAQYKGSSQHDAQEFLLWLLDRLNDELYHSSKKKAKEMQYKSKKEKNEVTALTSPEIVLNACSGFEVYNKFQALYQSSLTCPNCGKQSNTYESYLCLSLPVPQKSTRPVFVTVVYLDDSPKQLKIALEMNFMETIKELREKLAHELYVTPKRLVLCQLHENGFGNTFGDDQPLSDIHESENVYVFETFPFSEVNKTPGSDLIQILIVHVEKLSATKRFCCPEVIKISRDIEFLQLQRCILKSMRFAIPERVLEQSNTYKGAIFDIRVVDSGPKDSYLPEDVDMPLYTEPIDRALSIYNEDYGPTHIKFVIEWDPEMKRRLVDDDEDYLEEHQSVHKARLSQQQPSNVSLEDCLKLFTKEEKLGERDAWQCPSCEKTRDGAIKKLGLWSAPDILVIHLKRFRHSGVRRNKLNILVNFPVSDLEMGHHLLLKDGSDKGTIPSDLYDLYAVCNHYGNMSGGHYTAFCKNPADMGWYEYDDTHVKPLQRREIVSRAAYLLFYQRRKLTQGTLDSLQSQKHWVFSVYGPPRSMQVVNSSPVEEVKSIVNSPSRGKIGVERDYSDYYVERVRLDDDDDDDDEQLRTVKHSRGKSEPSQDKYRKEEELLLEELRLGINSPQGDQRKKYVSSPREAEGRDINSPRRDEMGINSPRQSVKHESPRKQLFPNKNQNVSSQNKYNDEVNSRTNGRNKITVAEQIVRSKQSEDKVDGVVLSPRSVKNIYRRSDSVDSSKNSHSYTSGSEISPTDSSPPSPLGEYGRNSATLHQSQANRNKSTNILNNERDSVLMNGHVPNSSKLKIHSNQIYKDSPVVGTGRQSNNPPKTDNQKVINNVSNVDKPPSRPDMFSTPQQVRKSPSPPVVSGRAWSTPQPQRKQYSDNKPPMDRQFSVPPRVPLSLPQYESQRLEIEGHAILDKQPRSLPIDVHTSADKPPLPVKASHTAHRSSAVSTGQDSRTVPNRPISAYARVQEYSDNRVSDYSNKPVSSVEHKPTGQSREPAYSDSRPVIIGQKNEDQSSRDRSDLDARRSTSRGEVRTRNRSADRQDRRSMRVKSERPISYHQMSPPNDLHEQYYLSQPIDDITNFERTGRYATMQPVRQDYHVDQFGENDYLHRHTADPRMLYHQPRSRAPINTTYNPQLYQDHSYDLPRYQPHLQTAKMLTKMALQEKEMLRMKQRMKSEYLKESSV